MLQGPQPAAWVGAGPWTARPLRAPPRSGGAARGRRGAELPVCVFADTDGPQPRGPAHVNYTALKESFLKITFIFFLSS